jgi:GSH-dependent disulfide-bond oxidoreductase
MIELWSWPTPNGQKVHILLEETGLPYKVVPVDIGAGAQFTSEFLSITPNRRIPAIVDQAGTNNALKLFESGAILIYLAEKAGNFIPVDTAARYICLQWLMFQMGGVGPMFGQYSHFANYAPEKIPYAIARYQNEAQRLMGVLEKRLGEDDYLAGTYSIADMAAYPWVNAAAKQAINLDAYSAVKRWADKIAARPAVERGMALMQEFRRTQPLDEKAKDILFGTAQFEKR